MGLVWVPRGPWLAWRRASGRGVRCPGPHAVVPGSAQRLQTSLPEAAEDGEGRSRLLRGFRDFRWLRWVLGRRLHEFIRAG